ncbi:MAG TPA: hypothetical protein VEG64_09365 [Candidatus Sulfotelmatobacter sp.]|nr:hypothetical protein [Candidatus Sulfotelmatobacter sp.]
MKVRSLATVQTVLFILVTAHSGHAAPQQSPAPAASQQSPGSQTTQPADPKTQPPASTEKGEDSNAPSNDQKTEEQQTGVSKDRLFWTLPNFLTVENASQIPPLSAGQKFKVVARSTFDPVEYPYLALVAAIAQAENSEPAYGQGWAAYGKRYGIAFGDNTVENFMVGAVFPSILHQDPRYYQLGKGSFLHRTIYAAGRMFITRSDSGQRQFNYSEIFGAAFAAGISTYSYHPHNDQNVDNALSVWGTQVGWDMVSTVLKEFWPDIRRKFRKEKERP